MRQGLQMLLAGAIVLFAGQAQAADMQGSVVDVFDGGMAVMLNGTCAFQKGERVDVAYLAGPVEMTIGQYEILQSKDNVFAAKVVGSTMPAGKGMNVRVVSFPGRVVSSDNTAVQGEKPRVNTELPLKTAARAATTPVGTQVVMQHPPATSAQTIQTSAVKAAGEGETKSCRPGKEVTVSRRWWLGVGIQKNMDEKGRVNGVKIVSVQSGSAAEKFGLKVGDVISRMNKVKVEDEAQFVTIIQASDGTVYLEGQSGKKRLSLRVVLDKFRPEMAPVEKK